jgi:hypothetical protein
MQEVMNQLLPIHETLPGRAVASVSASPPAAAGAATDAFCAAADATDAFDAVQTSGLLVLRRQQMELT